MLSPLTGVLLAFFAAVRTVHAIGQSSCVSFQSSSSSFPVVQGQKASPVVLSSDDWPGVQQAASDFVSDIQKVTGIKPSLSNVTASTLRGLPIVIGTLGKSSLINQIVNNTNLDVSSVAGKWEAFMTKVVVNPLPGVDRAYVMIGADKRGTIYAIYDHSEQIGVSPWYWWADVPTTKHSDVFVTPGGCSHGSPTVKYRGIFLNDEQPALQNWAAEKFTSGTGAKLTGSPFNHLFYTKLFELLLRLKANYLWPAIWSSAFAIDDPVNQPLADWYGVVMGTSHQEPMMRSSPIEFNLFETGPWDYNTNSEVIRQYFLEGAQRAKNFESVFTVGMRGAGDEPLSEDTNIALLQRIVSDQRDILMEVFNGTDITTVPQVWALYKEVEGYYEDGMRVPDDITLLWSDDNWGNIRRFPIESERNRTGGAGVYYHFDYVGDPRDYKWITTNQISKVYEQMSIAVDREATRIWIVNVGDLKPYERETEFFINMAWNSTRWNPNNLDTFVTSWAQREFDLSASDAGKVNEIVANLTRFNARRKHELLSPTTYSLIDYREAESVIDSWKRLRDASTAVYDSLPSAMKPAFFQMVQHPVVASDIVGRMLISAGQNNMRASQARLSTNSLADQVEDLFMQDFDLETQYHSLLDGKWDHMMDQTHLGYYYWQQPMANTMPAITKVQPKKQALAGPMRIVPEGTLGAWPGDNPNQCSQGFNCGPPSVSLDSNDPFGNRYIDIGAGGPTPFTFTATSNVSWLQLSPSQGSISPDSPEQRVFVSVKNWNSISAGKSAAVISFKATPQGQPSSTVTVNVAATRNDVPSGFKGFVEGSGVISMEAAHASRNTTVSGITWTELVGYGRTLSAVTPMPRFGDNNGGNFTAGSGPSLEYDFVNFNTIGGGLNVTTLVSPSLNANGLDRPLGVAVQIDNLNPQTKYFIPPAVPGALPSEWNTFVANSIVPVQTSFTGLQPGTHTLRIWMIEPAVVVQKIFIDAGGLRPSYLGPPESVRV
ncbi:glycoside hydrolase family 115 protein [Pleurotus ostreatus PC15]|uniref:Glycoside hydrolase family 115 protein n=1 Tax=Pleurotus ostreatus (strain PC15) TaxID=1137138 RepID=A0A067NJZ2_PLEO1|nr:glycoside hydrolase family 115 protein [Pleurotus ostreatus PC15]